MRRWRARRASRPAAPPPLNAAPEQIPLDVLYEDEDVVAVNKPAGIQGPKDNRSARSKRQCCGRKPGCRNQDPVRLAHAVSGLRKRNAQPIVSG